MSSPNRKDIRTEIKIARMSAGMSQIELANMCDKITNSDISAYENGGKNPSLEKLETIAKALNKEWKLKERTFKNTGQN